ncbi:sugar ABC transporter ATP-binding protein [Nocardioides soli]|uniref:ABC-type sugar transport system ATPase subunit n=1 Tax=Nocardioides soli TaxID=1036020 RepID=A0A7W4Z1G4_9ACTN|nr:sugar ABC transporter ATP-binding protein [Nocardioides soli]MBB3042843.1 ABC-type sugar transport system ATPase subunit [Nocardioides soli]
MDDTVGDLDAAAAVPVLDVRDLVKDYPGQRALDGAAFEVRQGEIHGLLGENGAGKSTLIKCVGGVVRPTSGEIRVVGQEVTLRSAKDAHALGISIIHQQSNLVGSLSIADNLAVGDSSSLLVHPRAERRRVREMLDEVGLDLDPRVLVASLRPHESAMVAVAKALHSHAKLVILDEPTTALSAEETDILFGQIRSLASRGTAFVYVSHRLGEVFRLVDRVTVLRSGRRIGTWDAPAENQPAILDAIVGDKVPQRAEQSNGPDRGRPLIEVRNLAVEPCADVAFVAHEREVVGLAGLTGSGAEEVASVLSGAVRPASGAVLVRGEEVRLGLPRRAIRAGIATIPKDRHREALLPGFSIRENISLASSGRFLTDPVSRTVRPDRERRAVTEAMQSLRVKATGPQQSVSTLSGGNQQKVVIARWLLEDFAGYVFIDPCAGVDIGAKAEIYNIIRARARAGAAVVFTSSEPEEYQRVCDRVLVFHQGRMVAELVGPEIEENAIVRSSLEPPAQHTLNQKEAVS